LLRDPLLRSLSDLFSVKTKFVHELSREVWEGLFLERAIEYKYRNDKSFKTGATTAYVALNSWSKQHDTQPLRISVMVDT
jgi:hypothetical protein